VRTERARMDPVQVCVYPIISICCSKYIGWEKLPPRCNARAIPWAALDATSGRVIGRSHDPAHRPNDSVIRRGPRFRPAAGSPGWIASSRRRHARLTPPPGDSGHNAPGTRQRSFVRRRPRGLSDWPAAC
jgi:hypothetical protein